MSSNESITTLREGSDELEQRRIDIEKLGRERPAAFSSTWLEIAFVTAMLVSLSMAVRTLSTTILRTPSLTSTFTGICYRRLPSRSARAR